MKVNKPLGVTSWGNVAICVHTFEFPEDVTNDGALMEKVYIDLRWEMTCEEYQAMPGWIPTLDDFAADWVAASEQERCRQARARQSFPSLV